MTRFTSRFIGMLAASAVFAFMLSAQPQRMSPQERTDRLTKSLNLSDAQQKEVLEIFTNSQEDMKKVYDKSQDDRDKMRSEMQDIRKKTDEKMKKVLTDPQYEKWIKQRENGQNGQGRRGFGPRDRQRPEKPDSTK